MSGYDRKSKAEFANFVAVKYVGTDPAEAEVMVKRMVKIPAYLGIVPDRHLSIDPDILCAGTPGKVVTETLFAVALAGVVENTVNRWYDDHKIAPSERARLNGYRPN